MNKVNKCISPVVATALLLVVAVIAVVGFQNWFQMYSGSVFSDVETHSNTNLNDIVINDIIGNSLYIMNKGSSNLSIDTIKLSSVDCNISYNLTSGINEIDISDCIANVNVSANDVVLVADTQVVEKTVFIDTVGVSSSVESEESVSSSAFVSIWNTSKGGSANDTIVLPLEASGTYNFNIDWGDGNSEDVNGTENLPINHTYATSGSYEIIIDGEIKGFRFYDGGDKLKIIDISQWGYLNVGNNNGYFFGCANLDISATDALDLTDTTDLSNMFRDDISLSNPDLSNWNMSSVINMQTMFYQASLFNSDISNWDVSSVVNMGAMFFDSSFNQDLRSWCVTNINLEPMMFATSSPLDSNGMKPIWGTCP